jgi:hypothetical protein
MQCERKNKLSYLILSNKEYTAMKGTIGKRISGSACREG